MTDEQKEILSSVFEQLSPEQREFIMNAFNKVEPEFLEYQPGKFISVHNKVSGEKYSIDVENEYWSCGTIIS